MQPKRIRRCAVLALLCLLLTGCGTGAAVSGSESELPEATYIPRAGINSATGEVISAAVSSDEVYFAQQGKLWHSDGQTMTAVREGVHSVAGMGPEGLYIIVDDPDAPEPAGEGAARRARTSLVVWKPSSGEETLVIRGALTAVLAGEDHNLLLYTETLTAADNAGVPNDMVQSTNTEAPRLCLRMRRLGEERTLTILSNPLVSGAHNRYTAFNIDFFYGQDGILVQLKAETAAGDRSRYLLMNADGRILEDSERQAFIFEGKRYLENDISLKNYELDCTGFTVTQRGEAYVAISGAGYETILGRRLRNYCTDRYGHFYMQEEDGTWTEYDGEDSFDPQLPDSYLKTIDVQPSDTGESLYFLAYDARPGMPYRLALYSKQLGQETFIPVLDVKSDVIVPGAVEQEDEDDGYGYGYGWYTQPEPTRLEYENQVQAELVVLGNFALAVPPDGGLLYVCNMGAYTAVGPGSDMFGAQGEVLAG